MHKYKQLIKESSEELEGLAKRHRNTVIGTRLQMLSKLKNGEARSIQEVAKQIGYSLRHSQRWFKLYQSNGLAELLKPLKPSTGGQPERITRDVWEKLNEALKQGEIASYSQARLFLAKQGVVYKDDSSILKLFKRHGIKGKVGRPVHEKANLEAQASFKKTSVQV